LVKRARRRAVHRLEDLGRLRRRTAEHLEHILTVAYVSADRNAQAQHAVVRGCEFDQAMRVDAVERGIPTLEGDPSRDRLHLRQLGLAIRRRLGERGARRTKGLVEHRLDDVGHAHAADGRMHEQDEHDHRGHHEQVGQAHGTLRHRVGLSRRAHTGQQRK
jgi:hypothetical protein